ncbi:cleft lip and palate transmembrane protein 1-like protein [Galendromus occidentalis]|uniref:Lipid scramblase CLPTM1L n=1 Tax=Galendromus occidentalis TaxID=34638 RepID=A0AAJ7WIC2_9ACAR|nr:cleft lip and palate transmembrane protein 1-like protein [Galendromus occidentalis]
MPLAMNFPSFSWGSIITLIFLGYIGNSMITMYKIYNPPECEAQNDCLHPAWRTKKDFKHQLVLIVSTELATNRVTLGDHHVILNQEDFDIGSESTLRSRKFKIPMSVRNNGTLYLHAFLDTRLPSVQAKDPFTLNRSPSTSKHSVVLTHHTVPKPEAISLMKDKEKKSRDEINYEKPYVHLPSQFTISLMSTPHSIRLGHLFPLLVEIIQLTPQKKYMPLIYVNKAAVMTKDLVLIKPSTDTFEAAITFNQVTIGKLKFLSIVEDALKNMAQFGISEEDTDGVKSIFFDTSLFLLLTTILVSSLHLIFDVMAFKNEVSFWKNIRNFEGISVRTIGWRSLSQIVILLYLYDNDTSRLVLFSTAVSTLIEIWKLSKALKVSVKWRQKLPFGTVTAAEKQTDEIDVQGMRYLSYLLWPLCIGGAVYSLYYQPHRSWYSWSVASLANGVYGFGFLLMLPQLFLNYRLKSVAHLPWKVFMYKACNTFTDDLFAFIIHMPTAHRVACFRDDAVFLVFLYQRWLYPVDKSRRNEFGESFADKKSPSKSQLVVDEKKKKKIA